MTHRVHEISRSPRNPQTQERYEAFLAKLSTKGRATIENHDELSESQADPAPRELWKRIAGRLAELARHAIEVQGQHSLRFYIADGKYRQQVFALDDTRTGKIVVYLPDVVQAAIAGKLFAASAASEDYKVRGSTELLHLERISAETQDLTVCKAMVGWGRRALRVELGAQTPEVQVHTVELMCELAAEQWPASA